jgi:hypothetical protein
MRQLMYVLQFSGRGSQVEGQEGALRVTATASSNQISTRVGSELNSDLQPLQGGDARFESEVTITGDGTFLESGTIDFGGGNRLRFSSIGQGTFSMNQESNLSHGAVVWRVDRGEGGLAGASGLITSNFTFNDAFEVTDNQLGLLFVPEPSA